MHKRVVPVIFILVIAVLALLVFERQFASRDKEVTADLTIETPVFESDMTIQNDEFNYYQESESIASLIPLNADETLFGVISQDFDGDGYEDQVNVVKNLSSPYISMLVGLYNPITQEYERSAVIATRISQVRTFSYSALDLIGEHKNTLVFQGFAENGNAILQAYFIKRDSPQSQVQLQRIANLEGDDSVFIQEVDRQDSYELSLSNGSAYPIWVYTSSISLESDDSSKKPSRESLANADQFQIRYNWNEEKQVYEETYRIRISTTNLHARELQKLLGATNENYQELYADFLEGLWYISASNSNRKCFLSFNWADREIIFFEDDTAEVYNWETSRLRRNGIYLTTTNKDTSNLKRHIDISLRNVNQIYVRLQDDLNMLITESTTWDGDYKKIDYVTYISNSTDTSKNVSTGEYIELLEGQGSWRLSDGSVMTFSDGNYVTISADGSKDEGIYTSMVLSEKPFIQFRSNGSAPWFDGSYEVSYGSDDHSTVTLLLYTLSPQSVYPASNARPIILSKNVQ